MRKFLLPAIMLIGTVVFAREMLTTEPASGPGTISVVQGAGSAGSVGSSFISLFAAEPAALTAGNVYYVDCGASSNGNGLSTSTPWNALSSVNSKTGGFAPGDQILFKKGSACSGHLTASGSGSGGSPIIVSSYGTGNKPIIQAQGLFTNAVELVNVSNWEVRNLEITNKPAGASPARGMFRGIFVYADNMGTVSHIYLTDNTIHDIWALTDVETGKQYGGIRLDTGVNGTTRYDDVMVANNEIYDFGGTGFSNSNGNKSETTDVGRHTNLVLRSNIIRNGTADGIIVRWAAAPLIERNVVHDCGGVSTGNGVAGLWVRSTRNAIVQYNEVYNQRTTGGDGQAFDADIQARDTIFQYNYSHNNAGGFLLVFEKGTTTGTIARYNISVDDSVYRSFLDLNESATIYNNVFVQRGTNTTKPITENGGIATKFYNNIFWKGAAPTTFYSSTSDLPADWQNNTFYFGAGTHPSDEPTGNGNLTSNPNFVSVGVAPLGLMSPVGYKLQPGSPALASGKVIASNGGKDYFGNTVPVSTAPNRGAYEGPGTTGSSDLTLAPVADAHVQDGAQAGTNFGMLTNLTVKGATATGYRRKTYLRFDLSGVTSVSSAKLRIYGRNVQDSFAVPVSAFSVADDTWTETGVNWNSNLARGATALGTVSVNATGAYYEISVASFISSQLVDGKASLVLEDASASDRSVSFNSRENAANPPQLIIAP